ncbi:ribonuclease hi [Colletotrichum incanum]|uniref:Ribonuclease hi n=1 Tax=Colletotrichum incanum TaxID=1573173 RepID=A0A162NB06_COLIC|nr:ribonuclease hi [Colletotrichum incanum]OHW96503.1 ribonuclease hi [Colletotrichum incanum]
MRHDEERSRRGPPVHHDRDRRLRQNCPRTHTTSAAVAEQNAHQRPAPIGVPTASDTKSRPEPATRRQRHTPAAVHAPTNTISASRDEATGSEAWHGSLQIRDKRSSPADPESLILAEVERLMAEYTRGINPNLPRKSNGKTYYVVWKGIKCGIFTSWLQCMAQTSGFSGARCMSSRRKPRTETFR